MFTHTHRVIFFFSSVLLFYLSALNFELSASLVYAQTPQESLLQHYNRGVELANQGDFEGAEREFKAVIEQTPRYLPAHLSLGLVYEALGRPGDAIVQYQTIVRLNRDSEEARQALKRMARIGTTPDTVRLIGALHDQVRARIGLGDLEGARQAAEALLVLAPENPGGLHLRGLLYVFMGEKEKAISSFSKALQVEPGYIPSRYELGLLYEDAGRVEEALQEFQAILSIAPNSPEARAAKLKLSQLGHTPEMARAIRDELSRGEEAIKKGRLDEAQSSIEKVLQQLPQQVGALHGLGLIHLRKGQLVEGQRALSRALEVDPSFARSRFLLGALFELQGRPEDALKEYEVAQNVPDPVLVKEATRRVNTLVEIINERNFSERIRGLDKPRLARTRFSEGLSAMQSANYQEAIEDFKAAIEIDPTNSYFHFNLGLAHINQKALVLAVLSFQKALELKPDHSLTLFWLGLTYQLSGDSGVAAGDREGASGEYKKAIDMLERSLRTNPEQWVVDEATNRLQTLNQLLGDIQEAAGHIILSDALFQAKDPQGALRELAMAAEKVPRDLTVPLTIGSIHEESGNNEEALQNYQKAAEVNPFHPAPRIKQGLLLQKLGQIEQAEKAFQKAVELTLTLLEPRLRLGGFYLDQKRFDEAKVQYEKAIEIDPKNGEAHLYLGQVYEQKDRNKEALKEYDTAMTFLDPESAQAKYIQDRKNALRPVSGSWSHNFFSYDNNSNSSQINQQESIINIFSVDINYIALRTRRVHRLLPIALAVPMEFQSSNTSLLRQERLFNTETMRLGLETSFLESYGLTTTYRLIFNYNDVNGPVSMNHESNISMSRVGNIPKSAGIAFGLSNFDSLVTLGRDRSTYSLAFFLSHNRAWGNYGTTDLSSSVGTTWLDSLGGLGRGGANFTFNLSLNHNLSLRDYGSANLGYGGSRSQPQDRNQLSQSHSFSLGYSKARLGNINLGYALTQDQVFARIDQSAKNESFSIGYSNTVFKNLSFNVGLIYTLRTFAVPRIVAAVPGQPGQGLSLIPTIETNENYSVSLGASHPLPNGLTLSVNYARQGNRSNLNIPHPAITPQEQLLQEQLQNQVRSTGTYQKHLVSFSLSKSF